MSNDDLGKEILNLVGGKDNVNNLIHCVTRLRFKLKDVRKADTNTIKSLDGVMTVVQSGGQYQVVIGDNVADIYDQITPLLNQDSVSDDVEREEATQEKESIGNRLVQTLSALFTPILGVLAAAGILKGILVLLSITHVLSEKSGTYMILYATADAMFYFLPILLGFSAAKVFKTNQYLGAVVGAALVYPTMVAAYNAKTALTFLKIPVVLMSYPQTLIPIVAAVYVLSKLYRWLDKVIPKQLKGIFAPLLSLVVVVPLTYLVVGPITSTLSQGLADAVLWLYNIFPAAAGFVLAGIWQGAVLLGLHWAFIPIFLNNIATKGFDPINAMLYCTVFGQVGAALAMAIKSKDTKFKEIAYSGTISGFLGITEPIIYGVTIPHKKSFVMASIGSAFGGAIAGFSSAKMFGGFASGGIFGIPMFIDSKGINGSFIGFCLSLIVAFTVALVLTLVLVPGVEAKTEAKETAARQTTRPVIANGDVTSPITGTLMSLSAVKDDVFAKGIMGSGFAIAPTDGKVYAPFDGKVVSVFPTKHAIGLVSRNGVELLIHIGLDTVELKGKYFDTKVVNDQSVHQGELLETFDIEAIKKAGYDTTIPVIVTNTNEFKDIAVIRADGPVQAGDSVLNVVAEEKQMITSSVAVNKA